MDLLIAFAVVAVLSGYFYVNMKAKAIQTADKVELFHIDTISSGVAGDFIATYGLYFSRGTTVPADVQFEPSLALLKCGGFKLNCDSSGEVFKISLTFYVNSDQYQYNFAEKMLAFSELSSLGFLTFTLPFDGDHKFPIYKNSEVQLCQ